MGFPGSAVKIGIHYLQLLSLDGVCLHFDLCLNNFYAQGARGFPGTPGPPGLKGHRVSKLFISRPHLRFTHSYNVFQKSETILKILQRQRD